jgi:hypothetical protein
MTADAIEKLELTVREASFPPYDAAHGTPDPMVQRTLVLRLADRTARFEQTDYGHPGRFNPWSPRGIDASQQSRNDALLRLCDSVSALL